MERSLSRPNRMVRYLLACCAISSAVFGVAACELPFRPDQDETDDGKRIVWKVAGHGWAIAPAYDSTTVFFGGMNHEFVAADKRDGTVLWRQFTDSGGVTLGNGVVRAGPNVVVADLDIFAFDAATGVFRWKFQPADLDEPGTHYLTADNSTVYAGSLRGRVYAIDATTGAQKWITQLPGDTAVRAFGPVARDGVVYVGIKRFTSFPTGALAALNAGTGKILWVREFDAEVAGQSSGCFGTPAIFTDKVIVGAEDGRIYALDRVDGSIIWTAPRVHPLPPVGGFNDHRPLVKVGETVVVGSTTGIVVGIDASTGAELWRQQPSIGSVIREPASDDEFAYVFFLGGEIIAFDGESGAIMWRAGITEQSPGQFWQPSVDSNYVYASGVNGFYALRKN